MTITINPFELLRFFFIIGWIIMAALATFSMMFSFGGNDRADRLWIFVTWTLCAGSAAVLYFGR
jgi:hypothetical protein